MPGPVGTSTPQTATPFQYDTSKIEGGKPGKAEGTAGSHGAGHAGGKHSVKVEMHNDSTGGTASTESKASVTESPSLPTGHGKIDASTQRLVDMAIAETKDGPAGSFLAKVLLEQAAQQRNQNMQEMVAARQTALSLNLAAAGQLTKAGQDLEHMAGVSLGMGLAGSAFNMCSKPNEKTGVETRAKLVGIGKGLSSSGEYASTHGQAVSKGDEADEKTDEAMAQQAEMVADRKKDTLDKIEELTKQVIDFLHNMQEANNDMMAAITRA